MSWSLSWIDARGAQLYPFLLFLFKKKKNEHQESNNITFIPTRYRSKPGGDGEDYQNLYGEFIVCISVSKYTQKHHPPLSCQVLPLNRQTVQASPF